MSAEIEAIALRSARWLRTAALPLWSTRGFDGEHQAFEEQLEVSGAPVMTVSRRLMVQARQISVFAAAALSGRYPQGADLALPAARAMISTYLSADGEPGWVFSVDRRGNVVDAKRDLYAHAFALFALAWVMRLERDPAFETAIAATLTFFDSSFADPEHGGYWDCLPRSDSLRRQNPHMHLLEALITLYDTTKCVDILDRCRHLQGLAVRHFIDPTTGALTEEFTNDWSVYPARGACRVEPGHLFEWAWLLRRYEAASGEDQSAVVTALIDTALRHGLDDKQGRVVDEIGEDGRLRDAASRSWPHAEALKALSVETTRGVNRYVPLIAAILRRLGDTFCRPDLDGGWIDHVDAEDRPLSKTMPASTLYHVYFGITAVESLLDKTTSPADSAHL